MIAVAHAAGGFPVVPFVIVLALVIVLGSIAYCISQVWDKEPWWRKTPKPSRLYRDEKDQVKIWKLQQKFPDAFKDKP